ncbi:hypothetical protein R6Q59_008084 [Mikania micrantha]
MRPQSVTGVTSDDPFVGVDVGDSYWSRVKATSVVFASRTTHPVALGFRVCEMKLGLSALSVIVSIKSTNAMVLRLIDCWRTGSVDGLIIIDCGVREILKSRMNWNTTVKWNKFFYYEHLWQTIDPQREEMAKVIIFFSSELLFVEIDVENNERGEKIDGLSLPSQQ